MPFEGQSEVQKGTATARPIPPTTPVKKTEGSSLGAPVRKQFNQPKGKLVTSNIGIKATLNPKEKKATAEAEIQMSQQREPFTFEELERVWKGYALMVKREKKDSLYSTLMNSKMTMTSDHQITLNIVNTVQASELEREKVELLSYIRNELKNYGIGLNYKQIESKKTVVMDSKGIFDQLAEDNSSLKKFRKLFNLDIEF